MTDAQFKVIKSLCSILLTLAIIFNPVTKTFLIPVIFAGCYKIFSVIPNE